HIIGAPIQSAGVDSAFAVSNNIIEDQLFSIVLRENCPISSLTAPQMQTRRAGEDKPVTGIQGDARNRKIAIENRFLTGRRIELVNQRALDVRPNESARAMIPAWRFAAMVVI